MRVTREAQKTSGPASRQWDVTQDFLTTLQSIVAGPQVGEVRQALTEAVRSLESSSSEDLLARVGVTCFVLARHRDADRYLSQVNNDGLAISCHAQSLASLERYEEAAARYEMAGE